MSITKKQESEVVLKDGYILDYISGIKIKETPEEVDAVQVFSKQLVEDYGYPKDLIQTRPQFRVKSRPSDTQKEYPVDIAVFINKKQDDNAYIIVECKKRNRKDGRGQLEDYLKFSKAKIGVWFNGEERIFLRKIEQNGEILFEEILNIPKYGQRLEDIGNFKRAELKNTHNLKTIFKSIRNYLAANAIGTTRDESLATELINIIFCKIYDEKFTKKDDFVSFRAGINEEKNIIQKRVLDIFQKVKDKYTEVFVGSDKINLDANSIAYVVGELQLYSLMDTERDIIADAFETFIGKALKGESGQFFTPRNVAKMMVECLDPSQNDTIIDPACGSGGFLIDTLKYVWSKVDKQAEDYNWSEVEREREKMKVATDCIRGLDKDRFLSKVTKAYMTLVGDGQSGVFCEDSLDNFHNWNEKTKVKIKQNSFSIVITNPPFGAKIPVSGEEKLKQYELSYKWKKDKESLAWCKEKIQEKEAPQILFIERCLQLLKDDGKMAIVLPDGIYGNDDYGYIRQFLLRNSRILALIDIPMETFMPNTSTKTTVMILQKLQPKKIPKDYPVFMAIAETCGHDRRGNAKAEDDIQDIAQQFKKWLSENINIE